MWPLRVDPDVIQNPPDLRALGNEDDDIRMRVVTSGSGPLVLFCHG